MDLSPVWISAKTASVSIVITFFWEQRRHFSFSGCAMRAEDTVGCHPDPPACSAPTVAGFFLLYIFGVRRPVGAFFLEYFGVKIAFSWGATVLAAVAISFPLMYRSARGAFEQVDRDLLDAGRTLGMSEWQIFRKILMPGAMQGLCPAVSWLLPGGWESLAPRP